MKRNNRKGFTFTEMLISITVLAIIASASTSLLSAYIDAYDHGAEKCALNREGIMLMERMTNKVRRCTFLLIPNSSDPTRDILAMSGFVNDDDDYYFNDLLFPRIDEDLDFDMNGDGFDGIANVDDDGDGSTDELLAMTGGANDDERSSVCDEDPIDGIDNDADGNVDEDCGGDNNNDGAPGIMGIDDDNDGLVDEGSIYDDDEDDSLAEIGLIPVLYTWDIPTNTLTESCPFTGDTVDLSTKVTNFLVEYVGPEKIVIYLTLTDDNGDSVDFMEIVYPRNTYQRTGKRVQ